jgi:hypothetical protein
MNIRKRPKLYPPKALLWQGPTPGPAAIQPIAATKMPPPATLPATELRRLVHEMLG